MEEETSTTIFLFIPLKKKKERSEEEIIKQIYRISDLPDFYISLLRYQVLVQHQRNPKLLMMESENLIARAREAVGDVETHEDANCQEVGRIEVYRRMHFSTIKGWISSLVEKNYDEMMKLKDQPPPEGSNPIIKDQVLGKGRNYTRGLGNGFITSRSVAYNSNNLDFEKYKRRAEATNRHNVELSTQLEIHSIQHQNLNTRQTKMEEIPLWIISPTLRSFFLTTILKKPTGTFSSCPKCLVANTKNMKMTIPTLQPKSQSCSVYFFLKKELGTEQLRTNIRMLFVKGSEDIHLKRMDSDLERAKVLHLLSSNLNLWLSLLVSPFMETSQNCLESSSLILISHLSSKATTSKTANKSRRML